MRILFCFVLTLSFNIANAQFAFNNATYSLEDFSAFRANERTWSATTRKTLYQRNSGIILGLQKGRNTAIELGGEAHWRKISLTKPHIIGATANMEYNFSSHVLGYKAGMWMKRGRINFTYGGNVAYYTNFKGGSRWGIGPSIGFRLLGLHLVNGIMILSKDNGTKENAVEVNSLYMSLRYYVPVENKFTWDRKTMKKKRERRKERDDRKRDREREREKRNNGEEDDQKKGLFDFKRRKEEPKEPEKTGLQKLFNFKSKKKVEDKQKEEKPKGLQGIFKSNKQQ